MSKSFRVGVRSGEIAAISFGERFQGSEQFDVVFREGMALVERTAAYLDGPGRAESRKLFPPATVLYATESMRLTTRLLDIASWLLIRRSLKTREITLEEAQRRRQKLKLHTVARPSHVQGYSELPASLRELVEQSLALHDRIMRLDHAMNVVAANAAEGAPVNPVARQISMLEAAFGGRLH